MSDNWDQFVISLSITHCQQCINLRKTMRPLTLEGGGAHQQTQDKCLFPLTCELTMWRDKLLLVHMACDVATDDKAKVTGRQKLKVKRGPAAQLSGLMTQKIPWFVDT